MNNYQQSTIFDFLSNENDPIYVKVKKVDETKSLRIGKIKISKNNLGFYEIESESIHEQFSNLDTCYSFICNNINQPLIGGYRNG